MIYLPSNVRSKVAISRDPVGLLRCNGEQAGSFEKRVRKARLMRLNAKTIATAWHDMAAFMFS